MIKGAFVNRKGKFIVVNLIMTREGGREYNQVYGTYIRENEAVGHCKRINRVGTCGLCVRVKDCKFGT
jgi:hypothetical protein